MTWKGIFLKVTIGALVGMMLGGIFGFGAGTITPELFKRIIPWQEVEPVGAATFFGATAGVNETQAGCDFSSSEISANVSRSVLAELRWGECLAR
jgi:hypothetical protein